MIELEHHIAIGIFDEGEDLARQRAKEYDMQGMSYISFNQIDEEQVNILIRDDDEEEQSIVVRTSTLLFVLQDLIAEIKELNAE